MDISWGCLNRIYFSPDVFIFFGVSVRGSYLGSARTYLLHHLHLLQSG
jgi:hypothetical protein